MTVNGPVSTEELGTTLSHEHILVDFVGANKIDTSRWDKKKVIQVALPYLNEVKNSGLTTFVDCTPAYLGRDVHVLKQLSENTGLHIITNTGYYGARNNKFLPEHAFTESADQLAGRWVDEWENGIEGTGVKPGFIKIGVDDHHLSDIHKNLITAAARTHLKTGLTIASHTGPAIPAFEQLEILENEGIAAEAFIWVHAQAEKDLENHVKAAQKGAWISLDGFSRQNLDEYVKMIVHLRKNDLLHKILLSHDAGWYDPEKDNGSNFRGYTEIFEYLIPALKKENFTESEINQLFISNPAEAFSVRIRKK